MSWFTDLLRSVFGIKPKKKDIKIPNPLPGSERMQLQSDGSERAEEAIAAIKGFVRAPYQITDRVIRIEVVSFEEGKAYFIKRGNDAKDWDKNHVGHAYAPMTGFNEGYSLIHLIDTPLSQEERVRWSLHEFPHLIWHYLLYASEWNAFTSHNLSAEDFANDLTRRWLGAKLDKWRTAYFVRLEARLVETGSKSQRH